MKSCKHPFSYFIRSLLLLAASFVSCTKVIEVPTPASQENSNTRTEITGKMTAEIDGVPFSANTTTATINDVTSTIIVSGINSNGLEIILTLNRTSLGAYELNGGMASASIKPAGGLPYYTGSPVSTGQVRISKIDDAREIISGTFSFRAFRAADSSSKDVISGKFEMNFTSLFTNDVDTIPGPTDNMLSFKMDGASRSAFKVNTQAIFGHIAVQGLFISSADEMHFDFNLDLPPGKYSAANDSAKAWMWHKEHAYYADTTFPIEVHIEEHDLIARKITGTFYLTARDYDATWHENNDSLITITEGSFRIYY